MSRSQDTRLRLEAALQRILDGEPERISDHRKLTLRAVEEEANLGNGSAYYYPDLVEKIKAAKQQASAKKTGKVPQTDVARLREAKRKEEKVKIQYRDQVGELKAQVAQQAAEHHQLAHALRMARSRIEELEYELADLKRSKVVRIK